MRALSQILHLLEQHSTLVLYILRKLSLTSPVDTNSSAERQRNIGLFALNQEELVAVTDDRFGVCAISAPLVERFGSNVTPANFGYVSLTSENSATPVGHSRIGISDRNIKREATLTFRVVAPHEADADVTFAVQEGCHPNTIFSAWVDIFHLSIIDRNYVHVVYSCDASRALLRLRSHRVSLALRHQFSPESNWLRD